MIGGFLRTTSSMAMIAAAGIAMGSVSASAADLGGNCCADLEERVAELEATTARKGNRKVSLQVYGQISEAIIFWNDGSEKNTYVQENNAAQNRLGFQGSAKINSDWSAGYKMEMQIRAYRSSAANQLALGASNNVTITAYNTQAISIREANWFLKSNTYGTITVGRSLDAAVGTSSISLVNPDGFSGPNGAGFASQGFFLRRAGTTGNAGLSARTWANTAWLNNGDGPLPLDFAHTNSGVKYTSPFFLGQTKSSGFLFSANWGMDDAWAVALRYVEDFGSIRVAAGASYSDFRTPDRTACSDSSNAAPGTVPSASSGSGVSCSSIQASGSLLHTPTGLYVSGGYGELDNKNAQSALRTLSLAASATAADGKSSFWYVQGGWQARLNSLGNTIFWGQYVDYKGGLGVNAGVIASVAAGDQLTVGTALAATGSIIRSSNTTAWGLGVSQTIDAAAMTLYAGFHNVSTDLTLSASNSATRVKSAPLDDMQVFYTGATIRF